LLATTPLLDLRNADIEALVARRSWRVLRPYDRTPAVRALVRKEIRMHRRSSGDF